MIIPEEEKEKHWYKYFFEGDDLMMEMDLLEDLGEIEITLGG